MVDKTAKAEKVANWLEKNPWALYGGAGGALLGGLYSLFNPRIGVGGLFGNTLLGGLMGAGLGWGGQTLHRNWDDSGRYKVLIKRVRPQLGEVIRGD